MAKKVWNTKLVEEYETAIKNGDDLPKGDSPFYEGMLGWKKAELNFEYTPEEIIEIDKCSKDVVYFTNRHGVSMTDDGVVRIKLRDYQRNILEMYQQERFSCLLASRQIGKCITSQSLITIKDNKTGIISTIPAYLFFYKIKKNKTFIDKIKFILYQAECLLVHGKLFNF